MNNDKPIYIQGEVSASYKGINMKKDALTYSELRDILLFDLIISHAQQIESYNIAELDAANNRSLMPIMVKNVNIRYDNPSFQIPSASEFRNLYKVIVTNVELHDTMVQQGNTYGKLTGTLYATLEPKVPGGGKISPGVPETPGLQTIPKERKRLPGGCLDFGLPGAGRGGCLKWWWLLALLLLLWCILSGRCGCNGCSGCGGSSNIALPKSDTSLPQKKKTDFEKGSGEPINLKKSTASDTGLAYLKEKNKALDTLELNKNRTPEQGLVTIQLQWDGTSDMDLAVLTPSGDTINYKNMGKPKGLRLDFDSNADTLSLNENPIEHIYLPYDAQDYGGTYKVLVNLYTLRNHPENEPLLFRLKITQRKNAQELPKENETYKGYLTKDDLGKQRVFTQIVLK